jgi:hypothetical protein
MKRKLLIIVLLLSSIFVLSTVASAAWYTATVNETGINPVDGTVFVKLTCADASPAWTGGLWFIATGTNAKAMLAVGLSALSTGNTVTVSLDNVAEWSTCSGLFMRSE